MNRFGLFLASFLLAFVALAQPQDNTILSTYRIMPKPGKDAELKKALTNHAAKYHKGDWRWRVFQVSSGADEGSYQLNEGPASWTALEGRKNISDEHDRDYITNVQPLIDKTLPASYYHFESDYSTDQVSGKFKKVLLRYFYMKPGKGPEFRDVLASWKKAFEKLGWKVTVWSSFFSGQPHFNVAFRLPGGWTDLEQMHGKDFARAFDEINGAGAYAKQLAGASQIIDRIDEDMMELLPEVSSPEVTTK